MEFKLWNDWPTVGLIIEWVPGINTLNLMLGPILLQIHFKRFKE